MHAFIQSGQGAVTKNGVVDSHSGYCVLCQKLSFCVCQRCGDFYCSNECQRKDWQRHRYICMPLPALIHASAFFESTLLMKTQAQPNFAVGDFVPSAALNDFTKTNTNLIGNSKATNDVKQSTNAISHPQQQLKTYQTLQYQPQPKYQQPNQQQLKQPNRQLQQPNQQYQPHQLQNQQQQTNQIQNQQQTKLNQSMSVKPALQKQIAYNHQKHLRPTSTSFPASNCRVVLSGFRSANRCYVRELNSTINDAYCEIVEKVNAYGKGASKLQLKPNSNSYAITKRDGAMHRVQILPGRQSISNPIFRVLFVDYGYIGLRNLEDLYEISDEIVKLPQFVVMIQLKGVRNYAMSDDLNAWLVQFEGVEYKIVYNDKYRKNFEFVVDLINWETNRSLNEEVRIHCAHKNLYEVSSDMVSRCGSDGSTSTIFGDVTAEERQSGQTTAVSTIPVPNVQDAKKEKLVNESPPQREKIFAVAEKLIAESIKTPPKSAMISKLELAMKSLTPDKGVKHPPVLNPPFDHKKLPITQNELNVFIVDNSNIAYGYIGCFDVSECGTLGTIQEYLNRFKDEEPYTPVIHEYIIAKFEDDWFRAKVLSASDGNVPKFTVIFIDFTNESTLTSVDIRRYPDDLKYDCYTNFCNIEGLPKILDERHIRFLKTKLNTNSTLLVNSVSYPNEDLAIITCDALVKELNDLSQAN